MSNLSQQHFSFPTLPQQEILDVFAELQIPLSNEVRAALARVGC